MDSTSLQRLRRIALAAVICVFLIVIAGAVVRASGSGMGCPDWPRCFGRLIPPTEISQIPPEYMEKFLTEGRGSLVHTWTEYINRLVGAASGLVTMAALILAIRHRKQAPGAWIVMLGGMVTFAVVAWLGKVVVDSTLEGRKISIHMLGGLLYALAMVAAYELTLDRKARLLRPGNSLPLMLASASLLMLLGQIFLGTRVREIVDVLGPDDCCSGRLEAILGVPFHWHKIGAWATVAIMLGLLATLWRQLGRAQLPVFLPALTASLATGYIAGVLLLRLGLPALLQPLHLLLAFVMSGMLVSLLLRLRR